RYPDAAGTAPSALPVALPLADRRPIHVLPIAWSVDGARGVHVPRSMKGHSLGLDLLVVSMAESAFTALSHCLELAHLDLQGVVRSEEHTSELQSRENLVCRLL